MHHSRIPETPIPVTIVGGYLGAGKTALVDHLLQQARGTRFAFIRNDFGGISTGWRPPSDAEVSVRRLSRGCICCQATTEFILALAELRSLYPRPDHVVVEASGVCDLASVAEHARLRGLRLDATVVVADAEAVRAQAEEPRSGPRVRRQLLAADLIVLNKIELLSRRERTSLLDWLGEMSPRPRILEASFGRVPVSRLVDHTANDSSRLLGERLPEADQEFMSWSWSRQAALDLGAFRWWAGSLPEGVLRGTGVLHTPDEPDQRHRFQLIGSRWSVCRDGSWAGEAPHTAVALVAHAGTLDPDLLDMRIAACARARPAPVRRLEVRSPGRGASRPLRRPGDVTSPVELELTP